MHIMPLTFSDKFGIEYTEITNDGTTLRMKLRGLNLVGTDFDGLVLENDILSGSDRITLNDGSLCDCTMMVEIPVVISVNGHDRNSIILSIIDLGVPISNGGIDKLEIRMSISFDGHTYHTKSKHGYFENCLNDLQAIIPSYSYIKACINCMYSDYSPIGNGCFGCMMCFRNIKDRYMAIKSKSEFLDIQGERDRDVQETYLCNEFLRRTKGVGYRG